MRMMMMGTNCQSPMDRANHTSTWDYLLVQAHNNPFHCTNKYECNVLLFTGTNFIEFQYVYAQVQLRDTPMRTQHYPQITIWQS